MWYNILVVSNNSRKEKFMIHDIQKGGMWKRISASMLDMVILVVVMEAFILLFSFITGFGDYLQQYDAYEDEMDVIAMEYYKDFGIDYELINNSEEFNKLPQEEQDAYKEILNGADEAFRKDTRVIELNRKANDVLKSIISLLLIVITFPVLISFAILEFAVPIIFKNGQTFGKKVFGLAVMRTDSIKVTPFMMFARGVLGKCTFGILVPTYIIIMSIFSLLHPIIGIVIVVAILLAQIVAVLATKKRTAIHDLLAQTIVVDMSTQMIFDTIEDRDDYYNRIASETAEDFGR